MSSWTSRRIDGWVPIGQYGVLGNGGTVALVAGDGSIDWWPVPTMDSPPVFAALLDPERGGCLELRPAVPFTVHRRYVGDSNVLETTFCADGGTARVTDALTLGQAGRLPWTELVRRVEGVEGSVPMRWAVRPGTRFETAQPWVERQGTAVLAHCGDQHLALRCFDVGESTLRSHEVSGSFRTTPGNRAMLAVAASDDAPVYLPERVELDDRLEATLRYWHSWSTAIRYDGPWSAAVRRSALALKLLQFQHTGALAAAATTSLPERVGGDKNWDYRYMWVRDASYTVDAFMQLGLHEEVQGAVTFLLGAVKRTTPGLNVFYKLDGSTPAEQRTLAAPGYRNSRPVRVGNGAADQTQLGTFGDLFDALWRYVEAGHLLDPATGRLLVELADRCCDTWQSEDAGIWELPVNRHYTISKMGCWVALDRAVRLHQRGQIATGHVRRWAGERDAVHDWVSEHCWSAVQQSYAFFAGSDELDAATLLAGQIGFDRGERLAGTIAAVQRNLARGPLVYRYSGMDREEGAFLTCTFWLISALSALGRRDEAVRLMDQAVQLGNDLGLLSEMMDPHTGELLGNYPQGLSHLALVNAAKALRHGAPADGSASGSQQR